MIKLKSFWYKKNNILFRWLFVFLGAAFQAWLLAVSSIALSYRQTGLPFNIEIPNKTSHHTTNSTTSKTSEKQYSKYNNNRLKGDEDASLWSNAFNFQKSWGTQVDPRTGTLVAYTKVGSMISNLGHGPNIDLEVSYNSNSLADPDGLGLGWSWNLTHFNRLNNQLSTSQGKSFNLRRSRGGQWLPRYHKLKDIQISGSKASWFVITYSNGLRETLNHEGYETRLEQQDGRWVKFSYLPGTHLLSSISDDQKHKIILTRRKGFIIITSTDAEGKPFDVYLRHLGGKLSDIALPEENRKMLSILHMDYLSHLLFRVTYPTGLKKNITYNCTDAMKISLQNNDRGLCVVVQTSVNPGMDQPEMVTRYTYGDTNTNEHNYLGFNSGLDVEQGSYSDTLFETPTSYTYKTTEDNGIIKQIRTYNKYHLLIDTKIVSDRTNHTLTAVHNFFCNTTESDGCAHTTFTGLPDTYSLPLKIVARNWGENSGSPATEITQQQYDLQGRLISTTDPYGRMEKISYCPAEGDDSCPAEPSGWSLSTQVESITHYPAYQIPGSSNLPIVIQHNHYKKESNSNGKGYILVLEDKTIKSGGQYTEVKQQYYDDPQDVFKYGLLKTTTETGTVSPAATFNSVTKNYYYILNINKTTKSFYSAVKLKSGQLKRSAMITTSLFTNQTIERTDAENKNTTRYHYDHWGRIIQVDSGADTAFSASKHYTYSISPGYIQLIITINNGLRKKIIFDGAGRQLKVFNEAIADTGKAIPGLWIPVKSRDYDSYGRITAEHAYYTDDSKQTHRLTTTFEYDALGRTYKVNLPDKETQVKMYDDPDRCTVSFTYDGQNNYSPVSIVHGNILDKPTEQMVLPAGFIHDYVSASSLCKISNTVPAARVSYAAYDGFGRKVSLIDLAGRKVTTMYDDAGRVATTTDPTGKQFHNIYDLYGNIIQKWITPANSNSQYLLASAQYSIGKELLWKAGEDGKKTSYTYTKDGQMATTVMPCGDVISWKYNIVGLPVSERVDGKESVHINYDPVTALPVKKRDITGITRWVYSDDGKVQKVFRMGENGYQNYYFSWQYDQNRRVISITDLSTNKTLTHYDLLGRIDSASYQQSNGKNKLLKMSVYDGFSREVKINYGSGMQRSVVYNEYGQTKNITDTLANKLLSAWQYSYDKEGNIVILMHKSGDNQQAILHYQYDRSNNLVTMNCSGSSGLPLCPRDTSFQGSGLKQPPVIISQNYSFNALNRMQQVKESLLNTSQKQMVSKIVDYSYGYQQAPLRLKQITTQWNDATPVTTDFVYDTTGNMVVDSEGNKISYNIFNQITKVITPDGKQTHYFYDSDGREVKETTGTGDSRDLFYVGGHLLNEEIKSLQQEVHTISYLGVGKALDGMIHEYYEQNYKGDVTGVLTKTDQDHYALSQKNIYSPYGMIWHTIKPAAALPWYQQTFIGFNGEQTDPNTGWQFLGAGHRTYNPDQHYFVSEDPAGDGYAFGCNNPIMNSDPTGNTPKWMGAAMHIMQYVGTLGMAAFHKRWTNIIGTTLMGALALAGLGATIACAGITSPLLIGASAGLTMDASVLSVAAAAVPTNRGLSIASAAVGGMAAAATFVMLGTTAVLGVSSLVEKANLSIDEGIDASVDVLEAGAGAEKDSAEPLQSEGSFITKNDSVNQYPSQDMHDAKYWIRNTVWTSDLNSYIRYEARIGESIFRIRNNASMQGIWSALCNSFSDCIKSDDILNTLFLIGREVATGRALKVSEMVEYLYFLSGSNPLLNYSGFGFPVGFFAEGEGLEKLESLTPDVTYAFVRFNEHASGYIMRDDHTYNLWHLWSFELNVEVFQQDFNFYFLWPKMNNFDLFVFKRLIRP